MKENDKASAAMHVFKEFIIDVKTLVMNKATRVQLLGYCNTWLKVIYDMEKNEATEKKGNEMGEKKGKKDSK